MENRVVAKPDSNKRRKISSSSHEAAATVGPVSTSELAEEGEEETVYFDFKDDPEVRAGRVGQAGLVLEVMS